MYHGPIAAPGWAPLLCRLLLLAVLIDGNVHLLACHQTIVASGGDGATDGRGNDTRADGKTDVQHPGDFGVTERYLRVRATATSLMRPISEHILGVNLDPRRLPGYEDDSPGGFLDLVREAGIRMIDFPMGCYADGYNWKNPNWLGDLDQQQLSVDQVLAFADKIGAAVYYNLNLAGGVDGTPHGKENCMKDRIGHHLGTLQETIELVETYGDRIKHYKLGNEPWVDLLFCPGDAGRCWTPARYKAVALAYAEAIKSRVPDAHLYLPSMSITMTNGDEQRTWTAMLDQLIGDYPALFEGVTEQSWIYEPVSTIAYWPEICGQNVYRVRGGEPLSPADEPFAFAPTVRFAYDEWDVGAWRWEADDPLNPGATLGHALYVAEMLRVAMLRDAPFSFFYSLYETVNATDNVVGPSWSLVEHGPGGPFSDTKVHAPFHAYRLMAHLQRFLLPHELSVPATTLQGHPKALYRYHAFIPRTEAVEQVGALVTTDAGAAALAIYLVNRSNAESIELTILLDDFRPAPTATLIVLAGADVTSKDVQLEQQTMQLDASDRLTLQLAPATAQVIELARAP